jgi:hypothetical protein
MVTENSKNGSVKTFSKASSLYNFVQWRNQGDGGEQLLSLKNFKFFPYVFIDFEKIFVEKMSIFFNFLLKHAIFTKNRQKMAIFAQKCDFLVKNAILSLFCAKNAMF